MLGDILGAIGGVASSFISANSASKQMDMQKKFAQKGIQWRVADATKAGIHPLYALGANTTSYSPVSVGTPDLGAMGQGIGDAIDRVSTSGERAGSAALERLALERAGLENDLLRANIARTRVGTVREATPPAPNLIPTTSVDPQQLTGINLGHRVDSNPYFSDAQNIEDRYGDSEILSMLSALAIGAGDTYWNMYRPGMGVKRPFRNPNLMGK